MKKLISFALTIAILVSAISISISVSANEEFSQSPNDFVSNIRCGWNLGNTLEATIPWNTTNKNPTPYQQETGWGNPYTTKAMIDLVANSGFNAVRIPVSWYLQTSYTNGKYEIKTEWLNRVKEIVDYCVANNLYVIVNMHHDDRDWLDIAKTGQSWTDVKNKYMQIWQQIATTFKGYGEKLILEGGNEILYAQNGTQCWWGHTDGSHLGGEEVNCFKKLNELFKVFVDTVRGTGGNNSKRYLMLPTYAAQWYSNQIDNLDIPNNDSHIIMDIHWYDTSSNTQTHVKYMSYIYQVCIKKNIAAVFGECGVQAGASDDTKMKAWAESYVTTAKGYNIPCFLWDDGGNYQIMNRKASIPKWSYQSYINYVYNASITKGGMCGKNLKWNYSSNGILNISGTGEMDDYSQKSAPWADEKVNIYSINISDGVTTIGENAFKGCTAASTTIIADSVESIGRYAFAECYSLSNVTLSSNITSIQEGTFSKCYAIESIKLPDTIKTIGGNAFYNCSSLSNINMPTALQTIGDSSFYECKELTELVFKNDLSNIGDFAFYKCINLSQATFNSKNTSVFNYSFYGCNKIVFHCYENSKIYKFATDNNYDVVLLKDNNDTTTPTTITTPQQSSSLKIDRYLTIERDSTKKLNISITPASLFNSLIFESNNENIAIADANGNITGINKGTAVITVTGPNNLKAQCIVRVVVNTKKINLSKKSLVLHKSKYFKLKYSATPFDNLNTFKYSTSNKKVATVSSNGTIKAISNGNATITVTASNGVKASCKVSVYTLKISAKSKTLKRNKSYTLKASGAKIKSFKSSKSSVAKVTSNGKITGKKKGTCYITVTDIYGNSLKCKITVK